MIRSTYLGGTLPSEIGLLQNMTKLTLSGTDMTGTIPTELGLLSGLVTLDLEYVVATRHVVAALCVSRSCFFLFTGAIDLPVPYRASS